MFPLSSWPDFGPAVDSSDGNVFLVKLALSCNRFLISVCNCWHGFRMTALRPTTLHVSGDLCQESPAGTYLFSFYTFLLPTAYFQSPPSCFRNFGGMFVVRIKQRLHICTIHLAGNERWGGTCQYLRVRDLRARDWPFILMEVFHSAGQAVYGCGNQGAINFWFPRQKWWMKDLFTQWLSLRLQNILRRD